MPISPLETFAWVSGISVHVRNALEQQRIATAAALAIGMVIGSSQVVARVAKFSRGRNLHPTWSARADVFLCLIGLTLMISGLPWLAKRGQDQRNAF